MKNSVYKHNPVKDSHRMPHSAKTKRIRSKVKYQKKKSFIEILISELKKVVEFLYE